MAYTTPAISNDLLIVTHQSPDDALGLTAAMPMLLSATQTASSTATSTSTSTSTNCHCVAELE